MMNNQMAEYQLMRFQTGLQNEDLRQRAVQHKMFQP